MKLQELLKGVAVLSSTADGEAEIGEVRYDSRAVGKGDLFVAIRGRRPQIYRKGARAGRGGSRVRGGARGRTGGRRRELA